MKVIIILTILTGLGLAAPALDVESDTNMEKRVSDQSIF